MKNKQIDDYFKRIDEMNGAVIVVALLSGISLGVILIVMLSLINAFVYNSLANGIVAIVFTIVWFVIKTIRKFGSKKIFKQLEWEDESNG